MTESPLTPEEKLLRIIETPKDALHPLRPQRRLAAPDIQLTLKLLKTKYLPAAQELLTLKSVNLFLVALAVIMTFFLIFDFGMGAPRPQALLNLEEAAKKMDIGNLVIERLDSLAIYMQEITQRNIFALPEPQLSPAAPKQETASELVNMASNFKVVGIIWSQAPQAILEDSKAGRTYLVNRGGKLKDARVKDILKDRVILSYDNQDVEVR